MPVEQLPPSPEKQAVETSRVLSPTQADLAATILDTALTSLTPNHIATGSLYFGPEGMFKATWNPPPTAGSLPFVTDLEIARGKLAHLQARLRVVDEKLAHRPYHEQERQRTAVSRGLENQAHKLSEALSEHQGDMLERFIGGKITIRQRFPDAVVPSFDLKHWLDAMGARSKFRGDNLGGDFYDAVRTGNINYASGRSPVGMRLWDSAVRAATALSVVSPAIVPNAGAAQREHLLAPITLQVENGRIVADTVSMEHTHEDQAVEVSSGELITGNLDTRTAKIVALGDRAAVSYLVKMPDGTETVDIRFLSRISAGGPAVDHPLASRFTAKTPDFFRRGRVARIEEATANSAGDKVLAALHHWHKPGVAIADLSSGELKVAALSPAFADAEYTGIQTLAVANSDQIIASWSSKLGGQNEVFVQLGRMEDDPEYPGNQKLAGPIQRILDSSQVWADRPNTGYPALRIVDMTALNDRQYLVLVENNGLAHRDIYGVMLTKGPDNKLEVTDRKRLLETSSPFGKPSVVVTNDNLKLFDTDAAGTRVVRREIKISGQGKFVTSTDSSRDTEVIYTEPRGYMFTEPAIVTEHGILTVVEVPPPKAVPPDYPGREIRFHPFSGNGRLGAPVIIARGSGWQQVEMVALPTPQGRQSIVIASKDFQGPDSKTRYGVFAFYVGAGTNARVSR